MTARRPLDGARVLVTRAVESGGRLGALLRARGALPVEVPVMAFEPIDELRPLVSALGSLDGVTDVVLTSGTAVRMLARACRDAGCPPSRIAALRVATTGSEVARQAAAAGFGEAIVPDVYVAERLAEVVGVQGEGARRVLYPRAEDARPVLATSLRAAGIEVIDVPTYRATLPDDAAERLDAVMSEGPPDWLTIGSSLTITHLDRAAGERWRSALRRVRGASIGPITSETMRALGYDVTVEASPHTFDGMVEAMERHQEGADR